MNCPLYLLPLLLYISLYILSVIWNLFVVAVSALPLTMSSFIFYNILLISPLIVIIIFKFSILIVKLKFVILSAIISLGLIGMPLVSIGLVNLGINSIRNRFGFNFLVLPIILLYWIGFILGSFGIIVGL